ncbi:MAG: DnaD domain protein [Firmicutes bacterium]|nr:DnaD domain protein [Bacillota bacterium]
MNFNRGKIRDFYLLTTDVENMFINEYLPGAPGEYVKVYLYGLLYAQPGMEMTCSAMAAQLGLSEKTLYDAWAYWEQMGVIKKLPRRGDAGILNFDVEFINLREKMYGNVSAEKNSVTEWISPFQNAELKQLFDDVETIMGRTLSVGENEEIVSWINQQGATTELVKGAFEYCCERGKANVKYVGKVVFQWHSQGLTKTDEIKEYIKSLDERQSIYKRILNSLGLNRNATEAERKMINYWIDDLKFNTERILAACDKTISMASPSLRYVNKVLENWAQEADEQGRDVNQKVTVTQAVLNRYYEHLRTEAKKEAEEKRGEVYKKVPRIAELDDELKALGSKLSRGVLTGMSRQHMNETRRMMRLLEEERAVLLTENNFTVDYTDIKYSCKKCGDTGIDENGSRCVCVKERIGEAEIWQNEKSYATKE